MIIRGQNLPPPRTQRQLWMALQSLQQQVGRIQKPGVTAPLPVQPVQPLGYTSSGRTASIGADGTSVILPQSGGSGLGTLGSLSIAVPQGGVNAISTF